MRSISLLTPVLVGVCVLAFKPAAAVACDDDDEHDDGRDDDDDDADAPRARSHRHDGPGFDVHMNVPPIPPIPPMPPMPPMPPR